MMMNGPSNENNADEESVYTLENLQAKFGEMMTAGSQMFTDSLVYANGTLNNWADKTGDWAEENGIASDEFVEANFNKALATTAVLAASVAVGLGVRAYNQRHAKKDLNINPVVHRKGQEGDNTPQGNRVARWNQTADANTRAPTVIELIPETKEERNLRESKEKVKKNKKGFS